MTITGENEKKLWALSKHSIFLISDKIFAYIINYSFVSLVLRSFIIKYDSSRGGGGIIKLYREGYKNQTA